MAYLICPDVFLDATKKTPTCEDGAGVPQWIAFTQAEADTWVQGILDASAGVGGGSFDFTTIDPIVATELFTAGFILCIVPWATAFGAQQLLRLLKY